MFASRSILRSSAVGLFATGLDFGALALLVSALGVPARVASVPALLLGILVQFVGNKRFVFRDTSREWLRQAGLFMAVEALGFLANLVVFDRLLVLTPLPYLACRLLSTLCVYFGLCWPLWARIFVPRGGDVSHARGSKCTREAS
jgi:putative flippase GtrA